MSQKKNPPAKPTKPPRKACRKRRVSDSVPCSIVIPKGLQAAIIEDAEREDRSFSATIRVAVERYLKPVA